MISLHDLTGDELQQLRIACAYLFSPDHARDDQFLHNLEPITLEKAYREKSLRYDPELHPDEPDNLIEKRIDRLDKIKESYQFARSVLSSDPFPRSASTNAPPRIIAIGGAKGGIGKSMLAVNLAVFLSRYHHRVVLVDLDLGGANLHLYMGGVQLPYTIGDYISGVVNDLNATAVATDHGPFLIGGNSSRLGAANIHFTRKLKLMRSVNQIQADVVILDLGADTSYNNIDFFLSADCGIVLTTCDPAAYLEAYNFIKVAVLRKLNRVFGPESDFHILRDPALEGLIKAKTLSDNGVNVSVVDILDRIDRELPHQHDLIQAVLNAFNAHLVVNMTTDTAQVNRVVERLQNVADKMLAVDVRHLGNLVYQDEIRTSTQSLVPAVAQFPEGHLARDLAHITRELGLRSGIGVSIN
jgi:flagellar biosynthesis protein FlhG